MKANPICPAVLIIGSIELELGSSAPAVAALLPHDADSEELIMGGRAHSWEISESSVVSQRKRESKTFHSFLMSLL